MKKDSKKIYGYIRASTEDQKKHGYSAEEQKRKIKGYCELHYDSYELIIIDDSGYSAWKKNVNRPGMTKVMKEVDEIDIFIFYDIDRFSR